MTAVNIEGLDRMQQKLGALGRQVPFAASLAINRTAQQVRAELKQEMGSVFDRPTPFTMRSVLFNPSTKSSLVAEVKLRDDPWGRSPVDYLVSEIFGGSRAFKRFETALHRASVLPPGMYVVPGAGLKLNAYGNVPAGQYTKVLSNLLASPDYYQNRTGSKRSRKNRRAVGYFYSRGRGQPTGRYNPNTRSVEKGHLAAGIWQRSGFQGAFVKPAFLFVQSPAYQPRFRFFEIAQRTVQRDLQRNLDAALAQAIKTAR